MCRFYSQPNFIFIIPRMGIKELLLFSLPSVEHPSSLKGRDVFALILKELIFRFEKIFQNPEKFSKPHVLGREVVL